MGNALRFKKFKYPGRDAYYYNAFVRDVIVSTIRYDRVHGWWESWHRVLISPTPEEKQAILDFVVELNSGKEV
jgi:hypothetical protein